MADQDTLSHARKHYRGALQELKEREWALANALVEQIQEHLHQHEAGLRTTTMLVKEVPEQPSLDHAGLKRETIKELEEMQRSLNTLKKKIQALRGVEG
jgi:hypothetical protein